MDFKKCNTCNEIRLLQDFPVRADVKGGYRSICIECNKIKRKQYREKNSEKIKLAQSKFYNKNKPHRKKYREIYDSSLKGYWVKFQSHKRHGKHTFSIDEHLFYEWFNNQKMQCHYCGNTLAECNQILKSLKIRKTPKRLEIDRKDSGKGYVPENMVFACTICNFHKSDFFNYSDFVGIAETYLKPKFAKLLRRNGCL